MTVHAKEIINGRFWIIENEKEKIATLSLNEDKFLLHYKHESRFLSDSTSVENYLGEKIEWDSLDITELPPKEVYNYPTNTTPFNPLYDVRRKMPLFTKSYKSKSLYCAGFYIIKFDKGWVKSFCPKLITLERYPFKGPFKTKIEMKSALGQVNAK